MIKSINSAQTTKKDNENQPIVQIKNVIFTYPVNYLDPQNWFSSSCKSSKKQNKNLPVLNGISFSAPRGQITALLGASGCGKTTLLKLILGLLAPQGGQVTVLGSTPGSQGGNSQVPGPGVGYLPQQVAMPEGHFTITELLTYFGRLRGMSSGEINSQISKLLTLLELPFDGGDSQPVFSQLSGGQQRRVSLAAALLNSPPLLVLDEPTVGVDPLLREIIWRHLKFLAEEEGVTVIITTHYIEEANSADVVALMRNGVLLAEQSPRTLLVEQGCSSIEEVFLKLSVQQDEQFLKPEISVNKTPAKTITSELNQQQQKSTFNFSNLFKLYRLQALLSKNLAYYTQNLLSTLLLLIVPTFFLCLSLQVFQNSPKNLPVAVINEEGAVQESSNLPKTLISSFFYHQNLKSIKLVNLSSVEQAVEQIIRGKAIAAIHFSENFTAAFERRQKMLLKVDPETIERSSAHLYLDLSNFVLGSTALVHLLQGFAGSIQEHFAAIGLNPNAFSLPVRVQEVVYGSIDLRRLTDPIVPGFMLLYVFFMNGALTAIHLVLERKSGLFERIQASGVTLFELQLSHLLVQSLFIVVQSGPLFGFLLLNGSFQFPEGSFAAVLVIYLLEGVAGVVYGLLLSVLFEEAFVVLCSLMGGVMTVVILGDVYWPVEFIPPSLSYLAKVAFPVTGSLKALKGVLFRGWALSKAVVLVNGVLLPVAWMVACLGLTVVIVKVKKRMVK